jgi:hypothetical protein
MNLFLIMVLIININVNGFSQIERVMCIETDTYEQAEKKAIELVKNGEKGFGCYGG